MSTPDRGALRATRSVVLAVFVVGLSALGHAAAGGHLPSAADTAGLALAVLACCALATRWRLPAWAAVALLAGGQVVLHAALERLAPAPAAGTSAVTAAAHAGHLSHTTGAVGPSSELWLGGPSTADASMLFAHVVVAAALALVYSRGEDAVWALCAWLAPLAVVLVALAPGPSPSRRHARSRATAEVPGSLCVLRGVRRRGPPAAATG